VSRRFLPLLRTPKRLLDALVVTGWRDLGRIARRVSLSLYPRPGIVALGRHGQARAGPPSQPASCPPGLVASGADGLCRSSIRHTMAADDHLRSVSR
jgi:hypothetical protein